MRSPRVTSRRVTEGQRPSWQERMDSLAYGDVLPLLIVADVRHGEPMKVDIALVPMDSVSGSGYSSIRLLTREFPYPHGGEHGHEQGTVDRYVQQTVGDFGQRLSRLLDSVAEDPAVGPDDD
jgi:hypothetical protein